MGYYPPESVGDALYPRGFRKTAAMALFFITTTLPTVFLWQNPPANPQPANGPIGVQGLTAFHGPPSRFGQPPMRSSFRPTYTAPAANRPASNWLSPFVQLFLATIGGAFSLALYYPRWGFKRFALLCGPILGFGTMFALGLYLSARTEVYRFEIVFASLIGAMPGLLLYLMLVYWKADRLAGPSLPLAPVESLEPAVAAATGYSTSPYPPAFQPPGSYQPPATYQQPSSIYPPSPR